MAFTTEELRQEALWRRCKRDPYYFLETFWKIRHPERGAILLELRDAQRSTLKVWLKAKMSIALKARQIGFSTLASGLVFWHIFFHEDRFIITLSKTERDAQKLKAKIDYGYKRLPQWMLARGPVETSSTLAKLEFDNGSSAEALPATDPARGESAYLIIVDEWAHFENPEVAWAAIEPAIDIGGRVVCLSSAKGIGNLFHSMWVGATTGSNDFEPVFHSWRAVPERGEDWYASKVRNLPEWLLHQEYPSNPEEAFIKSGNPVFDVDALMLLDTQEPARGYLHQVRPHLTEWRTNADGPLQIWEQPEEGRNYVIGADVAEGLDYGDYSVAHVIDTVTGVVVAKWREHIEPDLFGSSVLNDIGRYYNNSLVGVEVNNHGLTTLVALQGAGYGNLYYRYTYDERTKKKGRKMGWRTQSNTKPLMIDELALALRPWVDSEGDLIEAASLTLMDSETIGELRTFVRDGNGKTHGSPFDDQVISLAIANQMLKHFSTPDSVEEVNDEFTLDWWLRQAIGAQAADNSWTIGAGNTRR